MKKFVLFFTLFLFSCSRNEDLSSNFRMVVIDYQNKYPVTNPRRGNIYVYIAVFSKEKKDTIFTLTRTGAGLFNTSKSTYGLYKDTELKNLIVCDHSKLSVNQVKIYKKAFPDSLIWKSDSFPESITPVATYKLKNGVPKYVTTDTIWNHWD